MEGVGSEMGELGGWRRVSNPPAGGSTMREISRAAKNNGGGGDGGQTNSLCSTVFLSRRPAPIHTAVPMMRGSSSGLTFLRA